MYTQLQVNTLEIHTIWSKVEGYSLVTIHAVVFHWQHLFVWNKTMILFIYFHVHFVLFEKCSQHSDAESLSCQGKPHFSLVVRLSKLPMGLTELATIYYQTNICNNIMNLKSSWTEKKPQYVLNQCYYCSRYEKDFQDKCHTF